MAKITIENDYTPIVHDDKNITVITRVADAYRKIHDFRKSKDLYLNKLNN